MDAGGRGSKQLARLAMMSALNPSAPAVSVEGPGGGAGASAGRKLSVTALNQD